jgi:hypothetical protein
MKKLLVICCTPLFLFSQEKETNHTVEWNSNFLFESNGLDKSFLNTMLYGGHISNEMKTEWINAGSENNIIHSEISNGLSYTYYFKKQNIGFSFADRNILNASFTDDLLRIGFEGNYNYQDDTLFFNNTNIRADRFQQYKLSYGTAINKVSIQGAISYLAGNHHLCYILEKGSWYTSPFGTSLAIEYDMNAFVTDTSNFSAFANNGNGLAIDFSTNFSIKEYDIHLSITDLGFIMWNPSSINLATDSNFNFQGIEVEDIFSFNDSVLEANNIKDDVLRTNNTSFKSYIPATVHVAVSGKTEHKYFKTYTAGIVAKWQPYMDNEPLSSAKIEQGFQQSNFSPMYYLQSAVKTQHMNLIPNLSYGGYSHDFNVGLAVSKGEKHKFILGTQHLEDLLNGDKATAVSVYLKIKLNF